ncbi:MAG: class I SAM-dependent methyltransferase [Pseudonocardiaceae bacterium]
MDRSIRTVDDVLRLLDGLFAPEADRWTADSGSSWWDSFYADRSRPVPFFVAKPDENLVSYLDRGLITTGRALDLGCGPGRNALHLASAGLRWTPWTSPRRPSPGQRTAPTRRAPRSNSTAQTPSPSPRPTCAARTT